MLSEIRDAEQWARAELLRVEPRQRATAAQLATVVDLLGKPRAEILATEWRDLPWSTRARSVLAKPGTVLAPHNLRGMRILSIGDVLCIASMRSGWKSVRGCGALVNREIVAMLEDLGLVVPSLLDARSVTP